MARETRDKTLLAFGGGRFQGILRIAALKSTQCVLRKEQRKMKLIIWDFDGVTADTEKYWLAIELEELNKYCGLAWDFATINKYLSGQGLSMQQKVLAELGIYPPAEMWEEIGRRSWQRILDGFNRTPGMDKVLELSGYCHAMATGGALEETLLKLKAVGLQDVFTRDNLVTVDMVARGKPEPDSFLLAAQKMNMRPEDCYVIEDSVAGLTAAQRAGMTPVCFMGSEMYRNNPAQRQAVEALGITHIFYDMAEVKEFFEKEAAIRAAG